MKTTITDVAKQAGVSMKTVSRVLNNEPNVAPTTRERVMAAATALHYRPNPAARGLASSRSYLIALLYDNPNPSYITHIQRGAIAACRETGYHLMLEPMTVAQAECADADMSLRRLGVDGVILTPPLSDSADLRASLDRAGLPHVAIAPGDPENSPNVRMDDVDAAKQMTGYLIGKGHSRIGFIAGPSDHVSSGRRRQGYEAALSEAGHVLRPDWVRQGDFTFRSGIEAAEGLLSDPTDRPTAIFAANDDMAAGVVSVAGRLGIDVPSDLSVCGFDDMPIAEVLWPTLTTVAQPVFEMGQKAAKMLIGPSDEDDAQSHTLDFKIVVRESTAALPGGNG